MSLEKSDKGEKIDKHINNNSRQISSTQIGLHKNLEKVVLKHLKNSFQKPISQHTQEAFDKIKVQVEAHLAKSLPLIFDSCCGTAMSSQIIANDNPDALVLGIDKSITRLSKSNNKNLPDNLILVQAECADFWLLANDAKWSLDKHTILYPNPYPKSKHFKRRWHGHPAFPVLLSLGGELELRSNWKIYVEEFSAAMSIGSQNCSVMGAQPLTVETPLTLFEKKYHENGQPLYYCKCSL